MRTHRVEVDVAGAGPMCRRWPAAQPDLILLNDDDLGYAIVRFDERSLATLTSPSGSSATASRGPSAGVRSSTWPARPSCPCRPSSRIVAAGMGSEPSVVGAPACCTSRLTALLGVDRRPGLGRRGQGTLAAEGIAAAARGRAGQRSSACLGAAAGRDRGDQSEQLDLLAGLLDGSAEIPGLTVDTELRWALLRRLAATGRAGDAEIDAELARDTTDAGAAPRGRGRAAIPDAEHKAAAWQLVAESTELGLEESVAVARAFNTAEHAGLLAPYAEKYFEQLPAIWAARADCCG